MSQALDLLKNIFTYQENKDYEFSLPSNTINENKEIEEAKYQNIYPTLNVNIEYLKTKYNALISNDIKFREFIFSSHGKEYSACIVFIDGMVDSKTINNFVLKPLIYIKNGLHKMHFNTIYTFNIYFFSQFTKRKRSYNRC